jgi:hypothetical protein
MHSVSLSQNKCKQMRFELYVKLRTLGIQSHLEISIVNTRIYSGGIQFFNLS